jgi:hypothetical protein
LRPAAAPAADSETALWEPFDSDPRLSQAQRRALHTLYEKARAGKRIDLAGLHNLLAQLRRTLE